MAAAFGVFAPSLIGALLGVFCLCATATQTVYRCGPQGNEYSQTPCQSGRAIDVADPRSTAQIAEARKTSAAQSRLALQLANERRANERALRPSVAGGIDFRRASPLQATVSKPGKPKAAKPQRQADTAAKPKEFVAIGPGSGKKKKKAPSGAQV